MQLIRRGDSGPAVAEIRAALVIIGVLDSDLDLVEINEARFDLDCELAVRAFQQHRGLTVDGIVGAETYQALNEARWRLGDRVLRRHVSHPMTGDDVRMLQERLLEMGYNTGRPNGVFNAATEIALQNFQRDYGLKPDGSCGPHTLRAFQQLGRRVVGGTPQLLREAAAFVHAGPGLTGKQVVIDPGHGGSDRGGECDGLVESHIVWDIASRLEGRLMAFGASPILTRGPHNDRSGLERIHLANEAEADLMLSMHVDCHETPHPSGVATFYFGSGVAGTSCMGEKFAGLIHREIVSRTGMVDCQTHPKTWDLLRLTTMPAARLELGYLSNPTDRARLADSEFRDLVAESLLVAVQRLFFPPESDPETGTYIMPTAQVAAL